MPTVALATEFFDAFAALPRAQQKKVREFSTKFLAGGNPGGEIRCRSIILRGNPVEIRNPGRVDLGGCPPRSTRPGLRLPTPDYACRSLAPRHT